MNFKLDITCSLGSFRDIFTEEFRSCCFVSTLLGYRGFIYTLRPILRLAFARFIACLLLSQFFLSLNVHIKVQQVLSERVIIHNTKCARLTKFVMSVPRIDVYVIPYRDAQSSLLLSGHFRPSDIKRLRRRWQQLHVAN